MDIFTIKMVAIVTMIIDHVGLFFFPNIPLLRYIGRLSFPLFAWLIANGAIYTKKPVTYAGRLFILALISQLPFLYAHRLINTEFEGLNVVFTLFLGLAVITFMQKTNKKLYRFLAIVAAVILAIVFKTDYQALGILTIIACFFYFNNLNKLTISFFVLFFLLPYMGIILWSLFGIDLTRYYLLSDYQFLGIASVLFIYLYNQHEGYKNKYLFYYFYPLQYLVIILYKLYFKF